MKLVSHKELHNEWMKDEEYRAAWQEEGRKEKLRAFPQMNEYGDFPRLQIGIFSMDDTTSPFMGHKIERNVFG